MAWNRKKRVKFARGAWVGRLVFVSIAVACLALWYVWVKVQMVDLGYQMRDLEKKLTNTKKENQVLRMKISQMKSPKNIEAMIRAKDMNLTATKNSQVIVLPGIGEAKPLRVLIPQSRGLSLINTMRQTETPGQIPIH